MLYDKTDLSGLRGSTSTTVIRILQFIQPSTVTEQLTMVAFNASLLLFGSLLVSLKTPIRRFVDQSRIRGEVTGIMSMALSALQSMNGGSVMVRKCCVYLEWLIRISENMSRSSQSSKWISIGLGVIANHRWWQSPAWMVASQSASAIPRHTVHGPTKACSTGIYRLVSPQRWTLGC